MLKFKFKKFGLISVVVSVVVFAGDCPFGRRLKWRVLARLKRPRLSFEVWPDFCRRLCRRLCLCPIGRRDIKMADLEPLRSYDIKMADLVKIHISVNGERTCWSIDRSYDVKMADLEPRRL